MRLNKFFITLIFINIVISQSSNNFNGFVDYNYISKISDGSIINLPYRLFGMDINHENNDILFRSAIAVEHKLREDTYFLSDDSPSDFSLDMR